jgi:DNA-binding FadR family transcriptional regulator
MARQLEPRSRPHVTLAHQAAERLREDLLAGRWSVGAKLPSEVALADELGVGRSTAREAIQRLARDGLVEVRHGSGIFAQDPASQQRGLSVEDDLRRARIVEVYEVRRAVEVEAARLAATRATAQQLQSMRALLAERQSLVGADTRTFVDADLKFHYAVVRSAGNQLLTELFDQLREPLRTAITELVDSEPETPTDTAGDHEALLAALEARNPDEAARATAIHFDWTIQLLRNDPPAG